MKCFRVGWGLAEIIQERFRRFEVGRVEPFDKPAIDPGHTAVLGLDMRHPRFL